jgi:cytochrome b561
MATNTIWAAETRPLSRYTNVAILLHWAIAAMILFNLATGLFSDSMPRGIMAIHISSGITILVLSLVRIAWRLTHKPPPYPSDMKQWERSLSHVVHFCLYAAMLLLPFSGWAMISASPPAGSAGAAYAAQLQAAKHQPAMPAAAKALPDPNKPSPPPTQIKRKQPMIWWVIPLPKIAPLEDMGRDPAGVPAQREKHEQIETFHGLGGYVLLALLLLHIAGALKHQFVDKKRELARMGIGTPERVG